MKNDIKLITLGGVRENGMNMYVAEINNNLYILDCGLKYPENELLGIDVVIPDFTYLKEHEDQIVGGLLNSWTCRCDWGHCLISYQSSTCQYLVLK